MRIRAASINDFEVGVFQNGNLGDVAEVWLLSHTYAGKRKFGYLAKEPDG